VRPTWFRWLVIVLRWVTLAAFYWFVFKMCMGSMMVVYGWHRTQGWNGWVVVIDGLCGLAMYFLGRELER